MRRGPALLLVWAALSACQRPRSIDTPEVEAAQTLIYVALAQGRNPDAVWVEDARSGSSPPPFTLAADQERYVLWHSRSPERLGLVLGRNLVMTGRVALPPDGALRLQADGRWAAVTTVPGPLLALPLFQPQTRCERIEESPLEVWPGLPDLLDAEPIDDDTALITTRDQRVMTLDSDETLVELLSTPTRILAATHDAQAVYALDDQLRLTRRTWAGATTTTTTALGNLDVPSNAGLGVSAIAVDGEGTVHLYQQYSWPSGIKDLDLVEARVFRLVQHTFQRWIEPECGPDDWYASLRSPARRLAAAPDGRSVVACTICEAPPLRWRQGAVRPEFLPQVGAVRRLGQRLYAGGSGETLLVENPDDGSWQIVYRSGGGRMLQDVSDFRGEGLVLVGHNDERSKLTLFFPGTAEVPAESCFLTASWESRTRSIVRLGDAYLIVPDRPRNPDDPRAPPPPELPPQRLRLRYTDD